MLSKKKMSDLKIIFEKFEQSNEFTYFGKILGQGDFFEIRDINYKNEKVAGKIIKGKNNEISDELNAYTELCGQNIIKIKRIIQKTIGKDNYILIIMEKAILRDLEKLSGFYFTHNLLKTIYFPFKEKVGDNLLRFYVRQIINALLTLYQNYYVHFNLKTKNLLILTNLVVKLTDFSFIKKVKDGDLRIPGGTRGFLSPEYYEDRKVTSENARKQDYFALGSTIFYLKNGEEFLKYKQYDNNKMNADKIVDILQRRINQVISQKLCDKDFNNFLKKLIQYRPEGRPSFIKIYRNKWLNKDLKYLNETFAQFENDEEKLIMEFQKKDFFIDKERLSNNEILESIEQTKKLKDKKAKIKANIFSSEYRPKKFKFKKNINLQKIDKINVN